MLYMVVWIDETSGLFISDPEFFDLRMDAKKHRDEMIAKYPDRFYAIYSCDEMTV